MKKTLITLVALAGLASAATDVTIAAFGNADTDALKESKPFITDAFYVQNTNSATCTLSNGDKIVLAGVGGANLYGGSTDGAIDKTWENDAAVTEMNATLGLSAENGYSAADFTAGSGIYYTATGNNNSKSTLTLTLNSASVGDSITMYLTVASRQQHSAGLNITGLDASTATISYAGLNGDGFDVVSGTSLAYSSSLADNWSPNTKSVMVYKVTGTLTSTSLVMDQGITNKNGWQTLAYFTTPAVPEPATATLSLLALCGMASRRRRR